MCPSDYDLWLPASEKVKQDNNPLSLPYHTALSEAALAADFVERYWEPAGDRPGLRRVQKRLPLSSAEELRSLVRAIQESQTRLLLQVDPVVLDLGDRARFVVDELESAIEFTLDDGVQEEADLKLEQIKAFHSQDGQRSDVLAQALGNYAALADELKTRLQEDDEGFDPSLITEARSLAEQLVAKGPAAQATEEAQKKSRALTSTRNRMLHLLVDRVRLVRRTAAHVFKGYPAILREVTSSYERRRRAEARRKKDEDPST
jgi:hypothetical protein